MKKLLVYIFTLVILISVYNISIYASQENKITNVQINRSNEKIIVEGNVSTGIGKIVTIKVINPAGNLDYINQTTSLKNGEFYFDFKPYQQLKGKYTIKVGGYNVETPYITEFEIKQKQENNSSDNEENNGNNNENSSEDRYKPVIIKNNNTIKVILKSKLNINGNTAMVVIDKETMKDILAQTKDMNQIILLEVNKVKYAKEYKLVLPTDVLTSSNMDKKFTLKTPFATMMIPTNIFDNYNLKGKDTVGINIGLVDKSKINSKIKYIIGDKPVIELYATVDKNIFNWKNSNASVEVSIDYTPTEEELKDHEHIVIWYLDNEGNIIPVPNGKYDSITGKVIFRTKHFSKYAVSFVKKTFNDIENYQWAKKAIEIMASKGVINGTSKTTYNPENNITRADFVKLLVGTFELSADFKNNFNDIKSTDYYYKEVGIAKNLGIIRGVGNNNFEPEAYISRQDMMVIIARVLKLVNALDTTGTLSDISTFNDTSKVSNYAIEEVASLIKAGFIKGSNNNINPNGTLIRAEVAVLIYRIFNR